MQADRQVASTGKVQASSFIAVRAFALHSTRDIRACDSSDHLLVAPRCSLRRRFKSAHASTHSHDTPPAPALRRCTLFAATPCIVHDRAQTVCNPVRLRALTGCRLCCSRAPHCCGCLLDSVLVVATFPRPCPSTVHIFVIPACSCHDTNASWLLPVASPLLTHPQPPAFTWRLM